MPRCPVPLEPQVRRCDGHTRTITNPNTHMCRLTKRRPILATRSKTPPVLYPVVENKVQYRILLDDLRINIQYTQQNPTWTRIKPNV